MGHWDTGTGSAHLGIHAGAQMALGMFNAGNKNFNFETWTISRQPPCWPEMMNQLLTYLPSHWQCARVPYVCCERVCCCMPDAAWTRLQWVFVFVCLFTRLIPTTIIGCAECRRQQQRKAIQMDGFRDVLKFLVLFKRQHLYPLCFPQACQGYSVDYIL